MDKELLRQAFEAGIKYWQDVVTDEPTLFPVKHFDKWYEENAVGASDSRTEIRVSEHEKIKRYLAWKNRWEDPESFVRLNHSLHHLMDERSFYAKIYLTEVAVNFYLAKDMISMCNENIKQILSI